MVSNSYECKGSIYLAVGVSRKRVCHSAAVPRYCKTYKRMKASERGQERESAKLLTRLTLLDILAAFFLTDIVIGAV